MIDDAIQIQASGAILTTSATSQRVAIPNTASGTKPNYVRIQVVNFAYVKFGDSTVTAASTTGILMSPNDREIFKVSGNTHVAVIWQAAAGVFNIMPLEDF